MNEQLEFLISQYADGTLDREQAAALEAQLAEDPAARAELEKHRRLNESLRNSPTPAVNWDRLAARIQTAVALAPEPAAAGEIAAPASYRLFTRRVTWAAMAMAASVILAAGVAIHMFAASRAGIGPQVGPVAITKLLRVRGPHAQISGGPAVMSVSIGPGKGAAAALIRAADSRPPRMLVASGARAADDAGSQLPF